MAIEPGIVHEMEYTVGAADTAQAVGGIEFPEVLSTPRMIGWMEVTAFHSINQRLAAGQGTVGTAVNIKHLAATPVGMRVRVRAELLEVDRRRLLFKVEAWDEMEKIGEGEHERFIIEHERFEQRLKEKSSPQS